MRCEYDCIRILWFLCDLAQNFPVERPLRSWNQIESTGLSQPIRTDQADKAAPELNFANWKNVVAKNFQSKTFQWLKLNRNTLIDNQECDWECDRRISWANNEHWKREIYCKKMTLICFQWCFLSPRILKTSVLRFKTVLGNRFWAHYSIFACVT